jgi:hypothetical protein
VTRADNQCLQGGSFSRILGLGVSDAESYSQVRTSHGHHLDRQFPRPLQRGGVPKGRQADGGRGSALDSDWIRMGRYSLSLLGCSSISC